jgi:hypothetical protein
MRCSLLGVDALASHGGVEIIATGIVWRFSWNGAHVVVHTTTTVFSP